MLAPFTIVTLVDEDGDEFPIRLAGISKSRAADIKAAIYVLQEDEETTAGAIVVAKSKIEYVGTEEMT